MHDNFIIKRFDDSTGCILVEFTDTGAVFNIDLPVVNGSYPVGEELCMYIMQFNPTYIAERKKQVQHANNTDYIASLVKSNKSNNELAAKKEKLFNLRIKRTKILKESDWIVLPFSPVSDEVKQQWVDYRQKLRDITNNIDNIDDVLPPMPTQPENFWILKRSI